MREKLSACICAARARCYDPKNRDFKYYGARGITICDSWRFERGSFADWALLNGYKPGLYLDRINSDGPYSPENCRWVTPQVSTLNRRNTKYYTVGAETHTLPQWAAKIGVRPNLLRNRMYAGESFEQALRPPDVVHAPHTPRAKPPVRSDHGRSYMAVERQCPCGLCAAHRRGERPARKSNT